MTSTDSATSAAVPSPDPAVLRRERRGRLLGIAALGALAAWQSLDPLSFLLLYAWQWLLVLFLTLPLALGAFGALRLLPHPARAVFAVTLALLVVWGLVVAMPLAVSWGAREPGLAQNLGVLLEQGFVPLALPALALLAVAAVAGWQARAERPAGWPQLRRVLVERGSCHFAFLALGPSLYALLLPLGAALDLETPRGVALASTYALCEAWPFLRAWRGAPDATAPASPRMARQLARLRALRDERMRR